MADSPTSRTPLDQDVADLCVGDIVKCTLCEHPCEPYPGHGKGEHGDWCCTWCIAGWCQECGRELDENNDCPSYYEEDEHLV